MNSELEEPCGQPSLGTMFAVGGLLGLVVIGVGFVRSWVYARRAGYL